MTESGVSKLEGFCWCLVGQKIMAAAAKVIQFNVRQSKISMYRRRKARRQITYVGVTSVGLFF